MRAVSVALLVVWAIWGSLARAQQPRYADAVERQVAENSLAAHAKLLCSGVFVVGRDADEFIAHDLQREPPIAPGWDEITVDVDRNRKSVTLSAPELPPRTAVYNGSQGCTLLPVGQDDVLFEPVDVLPALPDAASQYWPTGDRLSEDPLPREVDKGRLQAAMDYAFSEPDSEHPQNTRAIVVVYKDRLIAEGYAPGFDRDTRHICWSMGKSITSALIGILVGQGHFDVDDPAPIALWHQAGDPRGAITMAHLLQMSGGLDFHMGTPLDRTLYTNRDDHRYVYFAATDVFEHSIDRKLAFEPGTKWRYRNCDPLTLGKIIRQTVEAGGEEYLSFPQRALFDKIGIRHMVLEPDTHGNFIMTGYEYGTARDWARFGLLHLHDGVWNSDRILPEGWVDFVRTPAPAAANENYGGLFWLNRGGTYDSLPRDLYWASGHHGQMTAIIPSRDVVIVRLGHSARGGFGPYIEQVFRRILAAIEPPA